MPRTARLDGTRTTLLFAEVAGGVDLVYVGPKLGTVDIAGVASATRRGRHEAQPNVPVIGGFLPQIGTGFLGTPAIELRRDQTLVTAFALTGIATGDGSVRFAFEDTHNALALAIDWRMASGEVVRTSCTLSNSGDRALGIDWLAALALPLPDWATHATSFAGRWSGEMHTATAAIAQATRDDRSRGGKQGFGGGTWQLVHDAAFGANHGRAVAAHLAWSGDYRSIVERDADGRTQLQLGARIDGGEIVLEPGARWTTPEACFAYSDTGRNGMRRAFHEHLRSDVLPDRANWPPRRVHLNSWDGLGFGIDEASLIGLADEAATLGIERFVVDDGWFAGRRDDTTSLGDWTPDPARFPGGLSPVIARVHASGMDFGLWVEPEMVSPDSELYRAHPDWCLHLPGRARPEQRQQLVLDLTRAEVAEHVFGWLDRLLTDHAVAYLKWDHNRDLFPLANADGPVGHAQTLALYDLLDRLRAAHPAVEIEACSSGGGRIDAAILERCHRVWPSDDNDAVERLRIQTAWSLFLPPEIVGSHVGPSPSPQTGRTAPVDFRAKVAMFGHMGVEADPRRMTERERTTLGAVIALYKDWREVLHGGTFEEIAFEDTAVFGWLARGAHRALGLVARTDFATTYEGPLVRLPGFDSDHTYRVTLPEPWPRMSRRYLHDPDGWRAGRTLSGRILDEVGLALPLAHPDTAWLIAVEAQ